MMTIKDIIFVIEITFTAIAFFINCGVMVKLIKSQKEFDEFIKKEKEGEK